MQLKNTNKFLEKLSKNNNREWFADNKSLYLEAKEEFDLFVNKLIPVLKSVDNQIDVGFAKECTFRIYKDVRFSKNKLPYKTNFGAYINKGGKKSSYAGFYVHIDPEKSFVGGGIYMPQANILKAIRTEIMYNSEALREIVRADSFVKTFNAVQGEKLKTAPRGYPKDHKDIDLLRFKSFFVSHDLSKKQVSSEKLISDIEKTCKAMLPFNNYFNSIIDDIEPEIKL